MASTYLTRTTGTPTDHKKYTFSIWIKRCDIGAGNSKIFSRTWGSGGEEKLEFNNDDLIWRNTSGGGGSTNWERVTDRKFRDCSAFYHICITFDSTQSTAGDRLKMWINGVQETSFSGSSDPSLNAQSAFMDSGITQNYGRYGGGSQYTSSIWSHVHLTDGTAYQASDFGQTDSTTGEWKIKTSPSGITYGTNGFWWFKDNADTTDNSPNSNTFTVAGGTLTKTEDNPSNNFATLNPLDGNLGNSTITFGNTRFNSETSSNVTYATSTLGMVSGKYYFEAKLETAADHNYIGISDRPSPSTSTYFGGGAYDYGYKSSSGEKKNNNSSTSYGNTYTTNDIVMCAVDLDNLKVYFGKNGTWENSGDPTSGSTGTGAAYTITAPSSTTGGQYFFCVADGTTTNNSRWRPNFGNGRFGDTAIASAGTNASGLGIFEYDVPTGYTALCTKGLNE